MLKDRVKITSSGFLVYPDTETEEQKTVCYGEFSLEDRPDQLPELKKTEYWYADTACSTRIEKNGCFIVVAEKSGDRVVDTYRFYFPQNALRSTLYVTTEENRKFGKNAYVITIEWPEDTEPEPINAQYIYLADKKGNRYYFLTDVIRPLKDSGKQYDQYIYTVPDNLSAKDFFVEADPLIRGKYNIAS